MNKHKVTLTITGSPDSSKINLVADFDPPITLGDDSNTLEQTVTRMLEGLNGRITAVDGKPFN